MGIVRSFKITNKQISNQIILIMAKEHKHYFINWIDGMKINKDHFISMENAMICQQQIVGKFLINPYNFGILPAADEESSLDIIVKLIPAITLMSK